MNENKSVSFSFNTKREAEKIAAEMLSAKEKEIVRNELPSIIKDVLITDFVENPDVYFKMMWGKYKDVVRNELWRFTKTSSEYQEIKKLEKKRFDEIEEEIKKDFIRKIKNLNFSGKEELA